MITATESGVQKMFNIHKTTLQLLKHKDQYDKLRGVIQTNTVDFDVRRALNTLDTYWKNYEGHSVVQPDVFLTELGLNYNDLDADQMRMYQGMTEVMMAEPDADAAKGLIRSWRTLDFAKEVETANENYHQGLDVDLFQTIKDLTGEYERDISRDINLDYCRDTIEEIIEEEKNGTRLPWFLPALNGAMPNRRTGHQIIFAARPGKGKTSFIARDIVQLAPKTPDNRPIIWFNNEGKGQSIKGTTYRAALGLDFNEIIKLGAVGAAERYASRVGGPDRIRIFDIHGRDYKFLERIIDEHRPAVVVFDMLDNVRGFSNADRMDLRLEQLYQWGRESAVIYDFLSLPTSQISVEGEGLAWCDQSMLKDSKTAKQGACEAIVTMGAKNGPEFLNSRFIYVPKTKQVPLKGSRSDCATEVLFDGPRCQFQEAVAEPNV